MTFFANIKKKSVVSMTLCFAAIALMRPVGVMAREIPVNGEAVYVQEENGDYEANRDINGYGTDPALPIQPPIPVPVPISFGQVMPARDMSTVHIPVIPHPAAAVLHIGTPQEAGQSIYTIIASSPITGVERMLLDDNRLVIDIINATTTLSGALPISPFLPVSGIRVSQFEEDVTRVVFDLESGTDFSIDISTDRTAVLLNIHQQTLYDFSFEAGEGYDDIVLTGVRPSTVRVQPGTGRLQFFISNTQLEAVMDEAVDGSFATHATLSGWGIHSALLELAVNEFTAHTILQTGPNETTIRLQPATYRNIRYNFEERTFRIPITSDFTMAIENVLRFDRYHDQQFILWLPVSGLEHLGFGEMLIADPLLRSVTIAHDGQATQLIFNGNQIFTLDLQEDDNDYIIRVMHPREHYARIVIIDPGHGGRDPGAVRNNIRESDLNLLVTNKLLQLIEADGLIKAYTTRNADVFVSLEDRANFGNNIGDMFVSIHFNASSNTAAHGIETYYRESAHDSFRALSSRSLAEIVHRHKLNLLGSNDRQVRSANFAVLRYSTIPAALLEMGFMSNAEELARMQTPEFQWQAARAIYNALLESFLLIPAR